MSGELVEPEARTDALARLATAYGIALDYVDTSDRVHRISDATLASLLATMGVRVDSDADIDAALAERERARWREPVAPLTVVRDGEPGRVRVRLAQSIQPVTLSIEVTTESGATVTAAYDATATPCGETATIDGETYVAHDVALPADLPHGYHDVRVFADGAPVAETRCAIAPRTCHRPPALAAGGRAWGASVQLYGVRSERNWGIGDFTDLATIVQQWGGAGAGVVGVNPLHALFPHDPERASPYSPSSRLFVNTLYVDVTAIAELRECAQALATIDAPAFRARLAALRDTELVDYAGVAAAKREVLELVYAHFRHEHLSRDDERAAAFRDYVAERGEALRLHATFDALQEHFARVDASVWGWPAWPEPFRDPRSPDVARFAREHAESIEFHQYLQWQADLQLTVVDGFVAQTGLGVGLYADLAVSIDRGGSESWANQQLYALDASVGAPPDAFSPNGQRWGLPPIVPDRLRAAAYAPFIATLRASMRHAKALRIDHVMGVERLFWVPPGGTPADGAYVYYPADDLFGLVALESERAGCVVIGEDLGTVPASVSEALAANDVLSCRVLYFERDADGGFRAPAGYPERALVSVSTHDLPTLAGWWRGRDIELRARFGLIAPDDAAAQSETRREDRRRLVAALERAGLIGDELRDAASRDDVDPQFARAVHAFIAATPSALMLVQLDDAIGVVDQPNLPGTTDQHPNWRRKVPLALERWPDDPRFVALAQAIDRIRRPAMPRAAVAPRATYRVQLSRDFTFADATALVDYLDALGVSHVYCSPYLRARPGSKHGYDIVDHASLNPEIGSRADFDRFVRALGRRGMSHLCDVVPNHMGVMGADNAWWMDVLENGRSSRYAEYFDIDWEPIDPGMTGRVLIPVLGGPYGVVLEAGELELAFEAGSGAFAVRYFDHRFPVDPRDYATIVERALAACESSLPARAAVDVAALVARLRALPSRDDPVPERIAARRDGATQSKQQLAELAAAHAPLADAIARVVRAYNGEPGAAGAFETLHALLEQQAYRLAYWRVASDEINYRRFFDINDLAALRMENDEVFDATHAFVLELAARRAVDGFRIDHPDGLYDPARYFERLQQRYAAAVGSAQASLYVVVEKIRAPHERLPESWPVHGDTGYAFANALNGVYVDGAAKARLDRTWAAFVGAEAVAYDEAAYRGKRVVMQSALAAELAVLANRATRIARADRRTRDFTLIALREALAETVAHFPVYRTYVSERGASAQDRRYVDWAIARAKERARSADVAIFDFVRALMVGEPAPELGDLAPHYRAFAMRVQQFTSPVAAKGIEDTAFYIFNRLVSLNDVGGDPGRFGTTVAAFHRAALERRQRRPATLIATSTHDNKRSEDVRARIDAISEAPAAWRLAVRRWSRMNRAHKRTVDGHPAPSRNDEYLLYQTLVGSMPPGDLDDAAVDAYRKRIVAYMVKAAREAKVHTSWISVNTRYEHAIEAFVEALLARDGAFFNDVAKLVPSFAWFGLLTSVSMSLVKLTQPGVPDIYQGCELLDWSLVDPDNRRPVDFAARRAYLASLRALERDRRTPLAQAARSLFDTPYDGRAKLWVAMRALALRRARPELFARGDYRPLAVAGARAKHVIAYARCHERHAIVVVAGRLFASLATGPGVLPIGAGAWSDTSIDIASVAPAAKLVNVLTDEAIGEHGGRLSLARAFASFPAALFAYTLSG